MLRLAAPHNPVGDERREEAGIFGGRKVERILGHCSEIVLKGFEGVPRLQRIELAIALRHRVHRFSVGKEERLSGLRIRLCEHGGEGADRRAEARQEVVRRRPVLVREASARGWSETCAGSVAPE
jgi:hypothetical protein